MVSNETKAKMREEISWYAFTRTAASIPVLLDGVTKDLDYYVKSLTLQNQVHHEYHITNLQIVREYYLRKMILPDMNNNLNPNENQWWDKFIDYQLKVGKKSNYPVWMVIAAYCAEFGVPDDSYSDAVTESYKL